MALEPSDDSTRVARMERERPGRPKEGGTRVDRAHGDARSGFRQEGRGQRGTDPGDGHEREPARLDGDTGT